MKRRIEMREERKKPEKKPETEPGYREFKISENTESALKLMEQVVGRKKVEKALNFERKRRPKASDEEVAKQAVDMVGALSDFQATLKSNIDAYKKLAKEIEKKDKAGADLALMKARKLESELGIFLNADLPVQLNIIKNYAQLFK